MKIPRSSWVLEPAYFSVKLVEDFETKYKEYQKSEGLLEDELLGEDLTYTLSEWLLASEQGELELYQYPQEPDNQCFSKNIIENNSDYFERYDDNWVIPRFLFEVL